MAGEAAPVSQRCWVEKCTEVSGREMDAPGSSGGAAKLRAVRAQPSEEGLKVTSAPGYGMEICMLQPGIGACAAGKARWANLPGLGMWEFC